MHHVAIMKKSWGLTEKILSGEKTIESRWYSARCAPWDRIAKGDAVYFKNSGEPVTLASRVLGVKQFELHGQKDVKKILSQYGREDGILSGERETFFERFKNKKYCILIFLQNVRTVRPFNIDKRGFGAMAAWVSVKKIASIKK